MTVLVGTSGWHYNDWRGPVYPTDVPTRRWLALLAGELPTVELNNTFYRLPERAAFETWATQVPPGFVFAVKASRYLTHIRRLRDPEEPVKRLLERADGLGPACGPFLVQLPPNLTADAEALDRALGVFGARRVAVELRHPSWQTGEVRKVLEAHGAACCWADRQGRLQPRWKTADWGYVRFHEGRATPRPCYGRTALQNAAEEITDAFGSDEDVYVYFNNDPAACAVRNARTFTKLVASP